MSVKRLLLINPWIYDFVSYDLWSKPLGLLYLSSILKKHGYEVDFVDTLYRWDKFHIEELGKNPKIKKYGDGPYHKEEVEKPSAIRTLSIDRKFSRYGITVNSFIRHLESLKKPDAIFITSGMTYWYYGIKKVIEILKKYYNDVPIFLGGVYATLMSEHAKRFLGVNYVIPGHGENIILKILGEYFDLKYKQPTYTLDAMPYPDYRVYDRLDYVIIITSKGCPFRCSYCASYFVSGGYFERTPEKVVKEIAFYRFKKGIKNIVIYDDAFLLNKKRAKEVLKGIIKNKIRAYYHLPNGLHARYIDEEIANLLYKAGFLNIRLGFEILDENIQQNTGGKVNQKDLINAMNNLEKAGYNRKDIGIYVMVGLPYLPLKKVVDAILFVNDLGGRIHLSEYSPVPHTKDYEKMDKKIKNLLDKEPLYHNNIVFPYISGIDQSKLKEIRSLVKFLNYGTQLDIKLLTTLKKWRYFN